MSLLESTSIRLGGIHVTNRTRLSILAATSIALTYGILAHSAFAADDKGPIKIGVPLPQTGALGTLYPWEKQAVDFAVAQANAKGGINGRKVEVRYVDTEAKPDVARKQIEKL